jgi:hypothetical protein
MCHPDERGAAHNLLPRISLRVDRRILPAEPRGWKGASDPAQQACGASFKPTGNRAAAEQPRVRGSATGCEQADSRFLIPSRLVRCALELSWFSRGAAEKKGEPRRTARQDLSSSPRSPCLRVRSSTVRVHNELWKSVSVGARLHCGRRVQRGASFGMTAGLTSIAYPASPPAARVPRRPRMARPRAPTVVTSGAGLGDGLRADRQ